MTISSERSATRCAGRRARRAVVGAERATTQRRLIGHLQSLASLQAPSVGLFIAHDGEPDLGPLIDWLWDHDQTVALPVLAEDTTDQTMWFRPWERGTPLEPGRYKIPVPPAPNDGRALVTPETLVVSLTGFDPAGNRMGRGGGFFDRYLANYQGNVVGVGFETQRFEQIPTEPHDIAVPTMVTELGIRFFS